MKVWIILDQIPFEGETFGGVFATKELAETVARELKYDESVVVEVPIFSKRDEVYCWRAVKTWAGKTFASEVSCAFDAERAAKLESSCEAYGRTQEEALANLEKQLKSREAAEGRP